jgi:SAM-dependent methyltransferase
MMAPPKCRCRICGNSEGNRVFVARDMMFGPGEEFDYLQCSACGSVQIIEIPDDMSRFYQAEYYSFSIDGGENRGFLRTIWNVVHSRLVSRPSFLAQGRWYSLLKRWELTSLDIEAVGRHRPPYSSKILDVGSGDGRLLRKLETLGYQNLVGIDPFLPIDQQVGHVILRRTQIGDLAPDEKFDLIILHHSLEHAPDPVATLRLVRDHLADDGMSVVAMPIINVAFQKYGSNWFQLDPPRHLHVLSIDGFNIALSRSRLSEFDHYFNSTSGQFRISEQYSLGIPLTTVRWRLILSTFIRLFSQRERSFRHRASELNRVNEGDQAVFYLRKRPSPVANHQSAG